MMHAHDSFLTEQWQVAKEVQAVYVDKVEALAGYGRPQGFLEAARAVCVVRVCYPADQA